MEALFIFDATYPNFALSSFHNVTKSLFAFRHLMPAWTWVCSRKSYVSLIKAPVLSSLRFSHTQHCHLQIPCVSSSQHLSLHILQVTSFSCDFLDPFHYFFCLSLFNLRQTPDPSPCLAYPAFCVYSALSPNLQPGVCLCIYQKSVQTISSLISQNTACSPSVL